MYQGMLKDELSSLLATGLIQGRHPKELSRHLQKLFGVNKVYADRLMRTELCRVQIEAQKQSYKSAGYQQYMFITTHDAKTCSICRPLDGKIFNLKDMQVGDNAPPLHPNCRCSTAAYMDREKVWAEIEGLNLSSEDIESKKIIKNLTLDDFGKANKNADSIINDEVLLEIYKTLNDFVAQGNFSSVSIKSLDDVIAFNSEFTRIGNWYNVELVINSRVLGNRTVEEIDNMFFAAKKTVCNTLKDGVIHEIYHAKTASRLNAGIIEFLNEEEGVAGVSKTAAKDMLETIAEVGVLKERGEYNSVPKEARKVFENYIGE